MTERQLPRANRVLEALPSEELVRLRDHAEEVDLVVNDVLHDAGSVIEHIYFPFEGLVSLLVVMPHGPVVEAGFVGSEGVVGTSYNSTERASFTRAKVVAVGRALRVPFGQFELTLNRSSILRGLIDQNNNRMTARAQQIAACNLLHRLESRLCRWLLQVFDNSEDSNVVITQDDLAQMLGVNRARLNEALKALQNIDAISQTQRGKLTIIDADLIVAKVCDCYGAMRVPKPD